MLMPAGIVFIENVVASKKQSESIGLRCGILFSSPQHHAGLNNITRVWADVKNTKLKDTLTASLLKCIIGQYMARLREQKTLPLQAQPNASKADDYDDDDLDGVHMEVSDGVSPKEEIDAALPPPTVIHEVQDCK